MTMLEGDRQYLLGLNPKRNPLHWMHQAICPTGLLGDRGCGLPTRWVYMSEGKHRPHWAVCPVCGRKAHFAWWKMKQDNSFQAEPEQEADVRALYADWKSMAKGAEPTYGKELWECIVVHCPGWVPGRIVANLIALGRGQ